MSNLNLNFSPFQALYKGLFFKGFLVIHVSTFLLLLAFIKGAGSGNRKQTCYLYNLHYCPQVAIVLCTDFGGWGESTISYS